MAASIFSPVRQTYIMTCENNSRDWQIFFFFGGGEDTQGSLIMRRCPVFKQHNPTGEIRVYTPPKCLKLKSDIGI